VAKVTINRKALQLRIESVVNEAIDNPSYLKEVAEFTVSRIRGFARNSKPLQGKDEPGKFPKHKDPPTPQIRRALAKYNKTHPAFSAKRTNLTFTGQLIEAVTYAITGRRSEIKIFVDDSSRTPVKRKDGSVIESGEKTNKAVYEKLLSRDSSYRFLGLDKKGIDRIKAITLKYLRSVLKKSNKK